MIRFTLLTIIAIDLHCVSRTFSKEIEIYGDPLEVLYSKSQQHKQDNKQWMNYVYKFIEVSGLNYSDHVTYNFIGSLSRLELKTQLKDILKINLVKLMFNCTFAIHHVSYILYRFVALGHLSYRVREGKLNTIMLPKGILKRLWHFKPINNFRLRIIIHNLMIETWHKNSYINVSFSYNNITDVFLGHYSNFYYYPSSSEVSFKLSYEADVFLCLNTTFDLMLANIVENFDIMIYNHSIQQALYDIHRVHRRLALYFVKCLKYKIIHIKIFSQVYFDVDVFDGPGF